MDKDIFYRPKLELDKHYETTGKIEQPKAYINSDVTNEPRTISTLIDEIEHTKKAIVFMPDPIIKITNTMLLTLQFILILAKDDKAEDDIKRGGDKPTNGNNRGKIIVSEHDHTDFDDPTIPYNLFNNHFKSKKLETEKLTKEDKLNRRYYKAFFSIGDHYLIKIKEMVANYQVGVINDIGLEHIHLLTQNYISNTQQIKDINPKKCNISDFIIKSQIIRSEKQRMLEKLFNDRESLTLIKSCELSRSLLKRYYNQERTGIFQNDSTLVQQIQSEEQKLNKLINQFYRYMNSSVVLTTECLHQYLKEGIFKKDLELEKEKYNLTLKERKKENENKTN